ncbi:MAG: hypothetical protein FJ379_08260 [Verrucomicrobia bacterium]|nr:hypothetical protein [Verrucomicrobiota bacterium]
MKRDINARLQGLIDDILQRLRSERDISSAFDLASWLATLLWKNHSRIYRLDALEIILLEKLPPLPDPPTAPAAETGPEIHLATKVYRTGGHTPLMAHLIEQTERPVTVILTSTTDVDFAAQALGVPVKHVQSTSLHDTPLARVHALVKVLLRGTRVIASIHPNDVLGAVALRMAKAMRPELPIGFMNHADHVFSTGIGACDVVFEISAYGWELRDARGTSKQSTFVGIPIRPAADAPANAGANVGPPMFLTGGSPYKFRPLPGLSLPPVLAELMRRNPSARLTVLGPSSRDWWWRALRSAFARRVEICKGIPKDRYRQLLRDCSVYIDSHPIPGGTALPEALMAGRNIAGIKGVMWGYSYADELLDTTPTEFQVTCTRLLEGDRMTLARQEDTRLRCSQWHAPEEVRRRLDSSWSGMRIAPPIGRSLTAPPERPLEQFWLRVGKVAHPGKRECPLSRANRRWLAKRHLSHFGWRSWSALKLFFYVYVKS